MENSCTEIMHHAVFWVFVPNITYHKLIISIFIFRMFTSLEEIIVQVSGMACLWVDTISVTSDLRLIMQKYFRNLVKKFTYNTSLVVIPFLLGVLRFITLPNLINQTYLRQNFILIHLMKLIIMLALLEHIFTSSSVPSYKRFIASLLTTIWYPKDGCANKYHCESDIYLLSCIYLEPIIIIDRSFGAPGHGKYEILEYFDMAQFFSSSCKFMKMKNIKL